MLQDYLLPYIYCTHIIQYIIFVIVDVPAQSVSLYRLYDTYRDFHTHYLYINPTLIKLQTLISVHIIGCRKTKLSRERKMFPVCGLQKYICISVVFRHLRNFPEIFRRFSEISGGFSEISEGFLNGKIKV